jgi:hypothetical protein
MQRFVSLVGQRVEVHYRASDLHLSVVGMLVSDTGECLVLEDRFVQAGKEKMMRVAIPYDYLVRIIAADRDPNEQPMPRSTPAR